MNKQVSPSDSSALSNGTNGTTSNNTHAQVTSTTSPSSSTTSQKPNQNIVDKLLNHLKAGNTPATNDNANISNNSNKINGTNHESNDFFPKKSNTNDLNQNTKTESPVKNSEIQQRIKRLQMPENEIQLQLKVHQSWKSTLRKTMMTKTQVLVIPKMIQTDYGAYAVNRTITVS